MPNRSRAWCFTINNPTDEDFMALDMIGSQYTVYGKELGKEGTPHLQGYMYFHDKKSMKQLRKCLPRAHLEVRVGTHEQARTYCLKDGDFVEIGVPPQKNGGNNIEERIQRNKRLRDTDLNELVSNGEISIMVVRKLKCARMDLAQESSSYTADGTRGVWYWGPPGAGKTHKARTEYGESFFIKAQNKWFDGYVGQETIVLDDLDLGGACLGHYLKIWSDKWACTGEIKGGTVNLRHKTFIVTSNYSIEQLWPEDLEMQRAIKRRFQVTHFNLLPQ